MSNEEKLEYLTNHHWKELSVFIEKAWEKRNEILYSTLTINEWKVVDKRLGTRLTLFIVIILLIKSILIYLPL